MSFSSKPLTINPIRILGRDESKNTLDVWWAKVKVHLKASDYKDLMVKTWTAYDVSETRGCTAQTICGKPHTAEEMSILIGDMLETIMSSVPEVTLSDVTSKATSLQWVYDFLRHHYGCERTGCDILTRFDILERKPGEKINSYWSRFKGFYQDNRIRKDDKLTVDGKKPTEDEKQCRFSKSTELAIFLHMTHPMLPRKMAQIFAHKLKTQDLASLQDQVLARCQTVLDELEGSHVAVNRMNHYQRPQHNRSFQARAPQSQRPYQRSGATAQRFRASSPAKVPKHPENFCFLCKRDGRPDASSHFLRQCPQLPERERNIL